MEGDLEGDAAGADPHVHVEARVVRGEAGVRHVLASTFGLVGSLPSVVSTGCGIRVPYAMTSPRPDRVTCLACREHARAEHLRFADLVEELGGQPGSTITAEQAREVAARHRGLAAGFGEGRS
ncbi:hypothetical protein ABZ896_22165 [Streptomyces sp. NPDC047072]|uniref:hypothetical protein n=1 Tax=Streptomyces sp. NPDC047072 TaxID=3154809 RepID=UPI0033D17F02